MRGRILAAVAGTLSIGAAVAAPLTVELTVPTQPEIELAGLPPSPLTPANRFPLGAPPFTTTLNGLDSLTFQSTIPPGKRIAIHAADPGQNTVLEVVIIYQNGTVFTGQNDPPFSVEFPGLRGTAPALTNSNVLYREEDSQVLVQLIYNLTGQVSFTGLRVTLDGPFNTLTNSNATYTAQRAALTFLRAGPGPATQFVFIEDNGDPAAPAIRIKGRKIRPIRGARMTIRGSASAGAGLARVEVKVGRKKYRPARGLEAWRFRVRIPAAGLRVPLRARAIDLEGRISPVARVTLRRPR